MILIAAIALFAFSCKDTVKPEEKETGTIQLVASEGSLAVETPYENTTAKFHTTITNSSTRDIKVYALMEVVELAYSHMTYFCWGNIATGEGECYAATDKDFLSKSTLTIKSGETTDPNSFIQYIDNSIMSDATSRVRYIIYEENNQANRDTIEYSIRFKAPF